MVLKSGYIYKDFHNPISYQYGTSEAWFNLNGPSIYTIDTRTGEVIKTYYLLPSLLRYAPSTLITYGVNNTTTFCKFCMEMYNYDI